MRRMIVEVARTMLAVENRGQLRHVDAGRTLGTVRVDLRDIGHEHEIATRLAQHPRIAIRRPGIVIEILVGPELHRIHEDAGHEPVAVAARRIDQAHVAIVKVSHGGNKRDAQALRVPRGNA